MANVGDKIKKDLKDLIASKTTQREQILDLLALKDVLIDEMDALIINCLLYTSPSPRDS